MADVAGNALFYGDNLDVLRRYVKDETVDLVYLDPPFNSNASYNVLFGHADGSRAAAQIKAFDDTWRWDQIAALTFQSTVQQGGQIAKALTAFQALLGPSTMLAYLTMMAPRIVELRRVLKTTGSLWLHCDPTASHYLKLLLDAVFGPDTFRNEVVWQRTAVKGDARLRLGAIHDVILVYARGTDTTFTVPRRAPDAAYLARFNRDDKDGRGPYHSAPLDSPSPRPNLTYVYKGHQPPAKGWRVDPTEMNRLDKAGRLIFPQGVGGRIRRKLFLADAPGPPLGDVWTDIPPLQASSAERLGYPTQKPLPLLERIIDAACPTDGVVLDPFCGCGTTIAAAHRNKRAWVGIDITYLAISLIKSRLTTMGASDYTVLGEPTTADDAAQLAADDPYQFQWWALGLIGARPSEGKKGGDQGIDGRLYFFDEGLSNAKQAIVSVKAGQHLTPAFVRELDSVVTRENAQLGVLLTLTEPTAGMRSEAASMSLYKSPWGQHPRIQLLTVGELLAGKKLDMPAGGAHLTQVALPPVPEPTIHPDQLSLGG